MRKIVKIARGLCPVCEKHTLFIAKDYWLRDEYRCVYCKSIPRHRAFMKVLKSEIPDYKEKYIHESSPSGPLFQRMKEDCLNYSYSYYYPNISYGRKLRNGASCENLEKLSLKDETIDIFITQDVLEHVNYPEKVLNEIARVLKPGGLHVFTVPIYPFIETRKRIEVIGENKLKYIYPRVYHGNPIDLKGSLVTVDWGGDIVRRIKDWSGMDTKVYDFQDSEKNFHYGLEADFLQVLISRKN